MQQIEKLKKQALTLMASKGFPIKAEVLIEVDESLQIMGYTTERNGKTVIVVSGWSLSTEMSLGLVIHELSHVYRIETNHPSHNQVLHNMVLNKLFKDKKLYPYQLEILHNIINNIQDLYADDISFQVFINDSHQTNLNEFFLGWIRPPLQSISSLEDKWKNAELLLSASFAQANLERHDVNDSGDKIENAISNFLSHIDKHSAAKFIFFKNVMVHFPEKVTDEEFEKILTKYITEFLKLIKE